MRLVLEAQFAILRSYPLGPILCLLELNQMTGFYM